MVENRKALLIGSFLTLVAAGAGFAVRGGVLGDWASEYGFTNLELGTITGGGLVGFGIVILMASLVIEKIGYKKILLLAFALHVLSAIITTIATPVFHAFGKTATYWVLYVGMFMFAVGNGLCEGTINPLIATAYSKQKTHYLNILHAGWPAGLIAGGLLANFLAGSLPWEILMLFFLIPTGFYGWITIKETFPVSEARNAGLTYKEMAKTFTAPILLILLIAHAGIGYVELGTDSWIANITDRLLAGKGLILFVYASGIMCILRFFAGPIVERINPLGLLCCSTAMGVTGLLMLSAGHASGVIWLAMTVYAVGKSFLWPTMLGIISEQFPRGGALTMGAIGGIGMLSAGLIGGPAIGYKQDYAASKKLKAESAEVFTLYAADVEKGLFFLPPIKGLDGSKVSVLKDKGKELLRTKRIYQKENRSMIKLQPLLNWWNTAKNTSDTDGPKILAAELHGGRMALKWTAVVPAILFLVFLSLAIYYKAKGGYKPVEIEP